MDLFPKKKKKEADESSPLIPPSPPSPRARPLRSAPASRSMFTLQDDTHTLRKPTAGARSSSDPSPVVVFAAARGPKSEHSEWTWWSVGDEEEENEEGDDGDDAKLSFHERRRRRARRRRRLRRLRTQILVALCYLFVVLHAVVILVGPVALSLWLDEADWCGVAASAAAGGGNDEDGDGEPQRNLQEALSATTRSTEAAATVVFSTDVPIGDRDYKNPDYDTDPCRYVRVIPYLLGLTLEECDMSRRMLASVILGGAIGYERRASDRPAGIRTMGLVSLGACFFTISSIMAFKSSTMGWDASRVTAALPSGVGFLGAALIWKGSVQGNGDETHQVHGLTTASSLWLSAAIGVGAGGGLYVVSIYSTVLILLVLRYGPKFYLQPDYESESDEEEEDVGKGIDDDEAEDNERDDDVTEQLLRAEKSVESGLVEKETERRSSRKSVVVIEPNFPESLTTDDDGLRGAKYHSVDRDSSRDQSLVRRRNHHRKSMHSSSRPTFHS